MQKVEINLTDHEADIIATYAIQLGYDIRRYIKYLVSADVMRSFERHNVPTFQMSKATERRMREALEAYQQGGTRVIKSMAELLEE